MVVPIKHEVKLPSELMPGLLPFRFRYKQCEFAVDIIFENFLTNGLPKAKLFCQSHFFFIIWPLALAAEVLF